MFEWYQVVATLILGLMLGGLIGFYLTDRAWSQGIVDVVEKIVKRELMLREIEKDR